MILLIFDCRENAPFREEGCPVPSGISKQYKTAGTIYEK